jgi:WD domain, G-beta repeat
MFQSRHVLGLVLCLTLDAPAPGRCQTTPAADQRSDSANVARRDSLDELWNQLVSADAAEAYRALWALVRAPEQTAAFLRRQVQPASAPDIRAVPRLITDLDNDRFAVRQRAQQTLAQLGEAAEPELREALRRKPSPEKRARLLALLDWRTGQTPERVRQLRAVEVLEYVGTPAAEQALADLARGAPTARLTREAKASLARMARRRPVAAGTGPLAAVREPPPFEGPVGRVMSFAFPADSKVVAASDENAVKLFDLATGKVQATLRGHAKRVWAVAAAPDGRTLASGSGDFTQPTDPGEVKLWDLATGKEVATLLGHRGLVFDVAFSPDGKTLASASWDQTVKLWDVANRKERRTLSGHSGPVRRLVFAPDGELLFTTSWDGTMRIWDPRTGHERAAVTAHAGGVGGLAISPDGRTIATAAGGMTVNAGAGEIKVWEVATLRERAVPRGHTRRVICLAFSPDGTRLAAGGGTRTQAGEVSLWDLTAGALRADLSGHKQWVECVAFTPQGTALVSGGGDAARQPGELRRWDLPTAAKQQAVP